MATFAENTAGASALTLGNTVNGSIAAAGEQDWYAITLNSGDTVQFDLTGFDTALYLYDSNGNLLASNDDGGTGTEARLLFKAATGGTYYLAAAGFDGSTGNYSLSGSSSTASVIQGGANADNLTGTNNADVLNGEGGNDNLYGNAGNDTLTGGSGNDFFDGGSGDDTYVLEQGFGSDTIRVASSGSDSVILPKGVTTDDISLSRPLNTSNLVLSFSSGDSLQLNNFFLYPDTISLVFADSTV